MPTCTIVQMFLFSLASCCVCFYKVSAKVEPNLPPFQNDLASYSYNLHLYLDLLGGPLPYPQCFLNSSRLSPSINGVKRYQFAV